MNKYKKKKNYLRTLFEFENVQIVAAILVAFVGPFLVALPTKKILHMLHIPIDVTNCPHIITLWFIGFLGVFVCILILSIIAILLVTFESIMKNSHAAKIMQYLPFTREDWEQFDAKTDEDAIRVLRDLVKTVGFHDDLKDCYPLCSKIEKSYKEFLNFKYVDLKFRYSVEIGETVCTDSDIIVYIDYGKNLVLCPDSEFETALKAAREHAKMNRKIANTKGKKPLYDKTLNEKGDV